MSYLSRENSNLSQEFWKELDSVVVSAAAEALTGRRFLHLMGPLGPGAESIPVDTANQTQEVSEDGLITIQGRKYEEIPGIYEDFTIIARDLEYSKDQGFPFDFSAAKRAAQACALKEDRFIYFGEEAHGFKGMLTAPGSRKIKRSDWSSGENAFSDIAAGVATLVQNGIHGSLVLIVSPDVYYQLQRIQPGTGLLELDRIEKLLGRKVLNAPALGSSKAILACPEPENMDLVIGQDLATAYLEQKDLNHVFRILETLLLRIKREDAIIVFE